MKIDFSFIKKSFIILNSTQSISSLITKKFLTPNKKSERETNDRKWQSKKISDSIYILVFFSGGIEMSGDGDSSSKKKRIATQKAK